MSIFGNDADETSEDVYEKDTMSARFGPKVSVIDDDKSVRESIYNLLRSTGISAEVFSSAQDLLEGGHLEYTACIILDIRMQGMTGLQLQRQLVDSGYSIPVIFVTAHGDENARHEAMAAGAIGFLPKPFDPSELLRLVQSAVK